MMSESIDITGQKYGKLLVLSQDKDRKDGKYFTRFWNCKCDCGTLVCVRQGNLRTGNTTNCGCVRMANGSVNKIRPYEYLYNNLVRSCNSSQRKRKIPVEMSYEEFLNFTKIDRRHYCDAEIKWFKHGNGRNTTQGYNLDRLNNSIGYIKENCVVCCFKCNWSKSDHFTYEQWKSIGKHMQDNPELFGRNSEN